MTNAITLVAATQSTASSQPSAAASAQAVAANAASAKPLVQSSTTGFSPKLVFDPTAGIITEFLDSSGQVQSQVPSKVAVAYLQAGLTPDGLKKPTPADSHGDTV